MPSIILGIFLYAIFEITEYKERMNNLAICLLAYIAIMEDMRNELPEISAVTSSDLFIILYIILSVFPIIDRILGYEPYYSIDKKRLVEKLKFRLNMQMLLVIIILLSILWIGIKYCLALRILNQKPPKPK